MFYIFFCSSRSHERMRVFTKAKSETDDTRPNTNIYLPIFISRHCPVAARLASFSFAIFSLAFIFHFFFVSFFLISKDMRSLNNLSFKPHVFTYRMRNKCVFFGARLRIFASVNVHVLHCPIYGDLCANGGQMLHGDRVCLLFLKKKNCCFLVLDGDVFNDRNHLKNEKNFLRRDARFSFREEIQFFRSFSSNAVYRRGQAHRHSYIVFNGRFFFVNFLLNNA